MKSTPALVTRYLVQPGATGPRLLASTGDDPIFEGLSHCLTRFGRVLDSVPQESRIDCMECLPAADGSATVLCGLEHGLIGVWAIPRVLFAGLADPFFWTDKLPFDISKRGVITSVIGDGDLPEQRNVRELKEMFKAGDGAFLMGGAQALVDSCKVRIPRDKPDLETVRTLWNFLPECTRRTVGFCTWTDDEHLVDGLSIVPATAPATAPGCLTADQCRDYPESNYESQLQYAIDYADQKLLDKLMKRRSSKETLSLAIWMVGIAFVVLLVMKILFPPR